MIYIWKGLGGIWHIGDESDYVAWVVIKLVLMAIALTFAILALIIVVPYSLVSGALSRVAPRPVAVTGGAAASVVALIIANVLLAPHPAASYQAPGDVVVSASVAPAAELYTAAPGALAAPTQAPTPNATAVPTPTPQPTFNPRTVKPAIVQAIRAWYQQANGPGPSIKIHQLTAWWNGAELAVCVDLDGSSGPRISSLGFRASPDTGWKTPVITAGYGYGYSTSQWNLCVHNTGLGQGSPVTLGP